MPDKSSFDQRDQKVYGSQINVAGDLNYEQPPVLPIPHQIPPPPQDFTGREDELQHLLSSFDHGATITGLRGMGGIGKTALALKLAELLRDRYPDGQLMVNLQGTSEKPLTQTDAMAKVIRSYFPTARLPEAEDDLAGLYRSVLDGKRALLLLDNALDDQQVRPLLPPAKCGVIVTSRRKFTLPGLVARDLDILKLDRAVELLLKVARSGSINPAPQEEKAWDEIARLCGFLPLALRAAGSLLANRPDLNLAQFAQELRDERIRLERIGKEGVDLDVSTSFSLSYQRLDPETARVFRQLSIFPSHFDASAEEVVCQDQGNQHLSELFKWSLVEYEPPSSEGEGRYHLHDLTRDFAWGMLTPGELKDLGRRHAQHFLQRVQKASGLLNTSYGAEMTNKDSQNWMAGQAWYQDQKDLQNVVAYGHALSETLYQSGHWSDYKRAMEMAADAANTGHDRKSQAKFIRNLGIIAQDTGDISEAQRLYNQSLEIVRSVGDIEGEAKTLYQLGTIAQNTGKISEARRLYNQSLDIERSVGDKQGEARTLHKLGIIAQDTGDIPEARRLYNQSLEIKRPLGNKFGEARTLLQLGIIAQDTGNIPEARRLYNQSLDIERSLGDKRGEARTLLQLGTIAQDTGDILGAINIYQDSLEINRSLGDRRSEGNALGNLGRAYAALGDARKAIEFYEQALVIYREIGDRRGEGYALWNMSLSLDELGWRAQAVECAEAALRIYEQIESPHAETVRRQLAEWHGDFTKEN